MLYVYISVRFGTKRIFDAGYIYIYMYIYGTVCQKEYSMMDLSLKMGRMAQIKGIFLRRWRINHVFFFSRTQEVQTNLDEMMKGHGFAIVLPWFCHGLYLFADGWVKVCRHGIHPQD